VLAAPASRGSISVVGSTTCATTDSQANGVYCAGAPANPVGVWYKYTGQGRRATVTTCGAAHAGYDAIVSVFTGTCAGGLTCVNAANTIGTSNARCNANPTAAEVDFCGQTGVDYLIYVRAVNNVGGDFDLTLTDSGEACSTTCTVPQLPNTPPGNVDTDCNATDVNGVCIAAVPVASCQPYYGTVDAAGGVVDADIYLYTVPAGDVGYTLNFQSEFPAFVNIIREADPAMPCQFITVNAGGQFALAACKQYAISMTAPAGDQHQIVVTTPRGDSPATCGGAGSHYTLRIDTVAVTCGPTGPDSSIVGPPAPSAPARPT